MVESLMRLKSLMLGITVLILSGCSNQSKQMSESKKMMSPPFGGQEDQSTAKSIWKDSSNYRSWNSFKNLEGYQDGQSPHGKFVRYYINKVAEGDSNNFPDGSVIVKENYMAKEESKLAAITIMKKIKNYDPENKDWFWVKFSPSGMIAKNPKGMALAGRVAKGMEQGCIACHQYADRDDFVYAND